MSTVIVIADLEAQIAELKAHIANDQQRLFHYEGALIDGAPPIIFDLARTVGFGEARGAASALANDLGSPLISEAILNMPIDFGAPSGWQPVATAPKDWRIRIKWGFAIHIAQYCTKQQRWQVEYYTPPGCDPVVPLPASFQPELWAPLE